MKLVIKFLLLILTLCIFNERSSADVTLGLLAELTGSSAANGVACREGYETAKRIYAPEGKVGSISVRFIFGDHKAEGKTAINEYQRMTKQEGAIAILSNRGNVGVALSPLSKVDQVPLIGMMAHPSFIDSDPYAFRVWPSGKQEGIILADKAIKSGVKKVAMLILEDDAVLGIADSFRAHFEERGGRVIYRELLDDRTTDYSTILVKARDKKPELLYIHLSVNQIGVAIKRARELGITVPVFSYFWLGYPEVLASTKKEDFENSTFVSLDTRKENFLSALEKEFHHRKPSAVTYACFTGLAFVLKGIESFETEPTKGELFEKLNSLNSINLIDENLEIKNREVIFPLKYKVVQDGVPVYQD